jgi:gamma-glutamyltranspeptidase/glutathione hydrolase
MYSSFGDHEKANGSLILNNQIPSWVRKDLGQMGYQMSFRERTSGPINAIYFDWLHGSFWGGSSNHGEDYGIGW